MDPRRSSSPGIQGVVYSATLYPYLSMFRIVSFVSKYLNIYRDGAIEKSYKFHFSGWAMVEAKFVVFEPR